GVEQPAVLPGFEIGASAALRAPVGDADAGITARLGNEASGGSRALGRSADVGAVAVGVLRVPPAEDVLPVLLAVCRLGPVLVVTPEVAQARLLASRLRRAGRTVALQPNEWAQAAAGVDVVIGARATVWVPCRGLAAIVVLDEHDEGLQEERQ